MFSFSGAAPARPDADLTGRGASPFTPEARYENACLADGRLVDVAGLGVVFRGGRLTLANSGLTARAAARARPEVEAMAVLAAELRRLAASARRLAPAAGEVYCSIAFGHPAWLARNSRGEWTAYGAAPN